MLCYVKKEHVLPSKDNNMLFLEKDQLQDILQVWYDYIIKKENSYVLSE